MDKLLSFFADVFDVLGDDLLCVLEQIRLSRKMPGGYNSTFIALIPKLL